MRRSEDAADSAGEHAIERAAAEWVLRAQGGLSPAERREFETWLRRDARHAEIFAEMDETSKLLDQLRDPALAPAGTVPFTRSSTATAAPVRRGARHWAAVGLAAAALVAVAWTIGARWQTARENVVATYATEVGVTRTVTLSDGSVVHLNTDTVVEAAYSPTERRVRLTRGEAFFSVAKNPQRPFWVEAGAVSVRAVGTAFNVRFRPQAVEVLVKEGKVSVNQATPPGSSPDAHSPGNVAAPKPSTTANQFLVAGERGTISLSARPTQAALPMVVDAVEVPRIESTLAWQVGRLEFTETPLSEVVAEFNRYNRHQLEIVDPVLSAEVFGGSFAPAGYESLIEVLEQSFGVVAERHENRTILRRAGNR